MILRGDTTGQNKDNLSSKIFESSSKFLNTNLMNFTDKAEVLARNKNINIQWVMGCWCSWEKCSSGNSKKSGKLRNPYSSFSLYFSTIIETVQSMVKFFWRKFRLSCSSKIKLPHIKGIKPYIKFSLFLPLSLSFNIGYF